MRALPESFSDTIVACATSPGVSAVAVVRLSGRDALRIRRQVAPSGPAKAQHLGVACLYDGGERLIDEAMVVEMHAPRSYTGEDVVEFHTHGSLAVVQFLIERCLELGARQAGPGEFTLRAFVNGRLSLDQAEAVGDLIAAQGAEAQNAALAQLQGGLAVGIGKLVDSLQGILSHWRAALDFPEYPTGDGWEGEHAVKLSAINSKIQALIESARIDIHRGRRVVLCGAPNVGKSTLFNAWVGYERALVDSDPGTTRDPIDTELCDGGLRWWLCDTAGQRAEASRLEAAGMGLARQQAAGADLILWLVDPDRPQWPTQTERTLIIGGKGDLASSGRRDVLEADAANRGFSVFAWVSGRDPQSSQSLRQRIVERLRPLVHDGSIVITRERHLEALKRADRSLQEILRQQSAGATLDVLAMELEEAVRALGSILGRDVDGEVLDRVFSTFCIGK